VVFTLRFLQVLNASPVCGDITPDGLAPVPHIPWLEDKALLVDVYVR